MHRFQGLAGVCYKVKPGEKQGVLNRLRQGRHPTKPWYFTSCHVVASAKQVSFAVGSAPQAAEQQGAGGQQSWSDVPAPALASALDDSQRDPFEDLEESD